MMKNKRVLVTGGAGSIGSEIVRQLYKENSVYVLDLNETGVHDLWVDYEVKGRVGDIRNESTVRDVFSDFKPQAIFHAAAYKHVAPMEYTPREAIDTNIIGTYNMLHYARQWECVEKFVFISTDKAINSNSIMGATKRVGEIMTVNNGYTVVRFGNVLGSRGSVIPIWQRQIERGEPVTVTDGRMERYFMTIEEAVELVIEAAKKGKGGEIMILDMGKPIKILELAKRIIKDSGRDIEIKEIGMRPGETLEEKLMTVEEEERAIKRGNFFVIK